MASGLRMLSECRPYVSSIAQSCPVFLLYIHNDRTQEQWEVSLPFLMIAIDAANHPPTINNFNIENQTVPTKQKKYNNNNSNDSNNNKNRGIITSCMAKRNIAE